jgi:hypothetical protein
VGTAADLIRLGQRLNIDIPDLTADDPDGFDVLLRDRPKAADEPSVSGTQQGHRKSSVGLGLGSITETDSNHDDALLVGKKEDPSFQDQKAGLLRDTSGHEHYIGPSGSLQFLDQLRRLLISRETEASTSNDSHATPGGRGPNATQALDNGAHFSGGAQVVNGGAATERQVSQVEDSLSPQATSSSTSGLTRTDEIHDLLDQIPEREIVESLLPLYWANAHDDFPLFHRETFEKEYQSFLGNHGPSSAGYSPVSGVARPDHGWVGCLLMMVVFGSLSSAGGGRHRHQHDNAGSKALQKHCVDATRNLLPRIVTRCSLSGVRALLLLAMFLHNDNERNAAWNLAGTATRICFALGLHRSDTSDIFSPVERETRRRVFCTLYGFEQFLASSLGRPSGVNDIDVQVVHPRGDDALTIMTLKLNKILSTSRNPRYASASTAEQAPHEAHQLSVEEVLASLKRWKAELASLQSLDVPLLTEEDDRLPVPSGSRMDSGELKTLLGWRDLPSIRALLLLYIQYHYIYILVTRPFLLRSITASGRTRQVTTTAATTTTNKMGYFSDLCFRHACQMARLLLLLDSFGLINGTSGLDVFFAYSAAMVLVLRSLRMNAHQHMQGSGFGSGSGSGSVGMKTEQMANNSEGPNNPPELKGPRGVGGAGGGGIDERSLLEALHDLIVRLRELVLKVPKSSTMERFARAMVNFEESAYHVKVKADPDDNSDRDPRFPAAQHHHHDHHYHQFGPPFTGPNLLFQGLMDASYGTPGGGGGSAPSAADVAAASMDQQMPDGPADGGGGGGIMPDHAPQQQQQQQQQFLGNGWAAVPGPTTTTNTTTTTTPAAAAAAAMGQQGGGATYGNQVNGLTSFDYFPPGLNPWAAMGGNLDNAPDPGTEMPIYGWEDLESMLGNGRSSQSRKF